MQRAFIKEKLDRRTISCLIKNNKFFVNYDKDWSVIWYINKFIMTWKPEKNKISDAMLDEMYEETQDDLFLNLKEYRKISKRIKELKANRKAISCDKALTKSSKLKESEGPCNTSKIAIDSTDRIGKIYSL